MSFCPNCECPSCQQARLGHDPYQRAKADALRLIAGAGQLGFTNSELQKFSRHFRALYPVARKEALDELVNEGRLVCRKFPPPARRGKSRLAFIAAQVSQ
jgi:hypothetical protein